MKAPCNCVPRVRLRGDGALPLQVLLRGLGGQADGGLAEGLQQQVQQGDLLQHIQLQVT